MLLFVGVIALSVYGSESAVVRVPNMPYLYEIARPRDSEFAESRMIPVHPVRGFQAQPSETRTARAARPQARAELRAPPARLQALPAEEDTTKEPEIQRPYKIAYDSVDANGTQQRREETKDDKGVVRGSYR